MSWRTVVVTQNAKLDYQLGYLVIRGQDTHKIHLNEIAVLIIESTSVSLTTYLLNELSKNKVKVIFCDEKRNPFCELLPYYGSHDTSQKIRKQIAWTDYDKQMIWTEIVAEKINKQAAVLETFGKSEANMLRGYIEELEFGDASNREGHAAKVYFNALFGKSFTRADDNSINAALNYGYSILLSMFNREVVANGYITQIGVFHDNMFNQYNLASDLMEPFRPLVDSFVYLMKPEVFESDEKHEVLQLLEQDVYIDGRKENMLNGIKIYTKSIFDALNEKDTSLIKFYRL